MTPEEEIRDTYNRHNVKLATAEFFSNGKSFWSLSQYGYVMKGNFLTIEEAEQYSIDYYLSRMNLIRQ